MAKHSTWYNLKQLKAILIDGRKQQQELASAENLLTHCPQVDVIAEAENGEEGIKAIETHKPDIVFLDVEMPRMNGFNMLQQLQHRILN